MIESKMCGTCEYGDVWEQYCSIASTGIWEEYYCGLWEPACGKWIATEKFRPNDAQIVMVNYNGKIYIAKYNGLKGAFKIFGRGYKPAGEVKAWQRVERKIE